MFTVYKITNIINNKSYIGSSTRVEKRWQEEKNAAFNEKSSSYNYPLSRAFRKYGLENFKFEILKNDFSTVEEMEDYEQKMIIYYDTLKNGYNQTLYTHCVLRDPKIKEQLVQKYGKKCCLIDEKGNILEIYDSLQEAGRCNFGDNRGSSVKKICEGEAYSINDKIFRYLDDKQEIVQIENKTRKRRLHPKPIGVEHKTRKRRIKIAGIPLNDPSNIVYADSILQASQIYGINRCSIEKCRNGEKRYSNVGGYIWREVDEDNNIIENNLLVQDLIDEYNKTHPLINGERHTLTEWCKIYNISTHSVYERIKKGMSVIEAITAPKRR